jgi:hypothetical protein
MEGHLVNECLRMRGLGPPQNLMVTPPGPMGGVAQVSMNSSFHNPTPYHAFPGGQAAPTKNIVKSVESTTMGQDSAPSCRNI